MAEPKERPAYIRDAERHVAVALANLWVWSAVVEEKRLPTTATAWVYPRDMALGGPKQLNGKRVRVTLTVEDDDA